MTARHPHFYSPPVVEEVTVPSPHDRTLSLFHPNHGDGTKEKMPTKFSSLSSLPTVKDFSAPSRERTLFLMHLNLAAYPSCEEGDLHGHHCSYPDATLQELWNENQSLYGPNVTNPELENEAANQFHEDNWNLLLTDPNLKGYQSHSIPESTAEFEVGIQALEWVTSNAIILVFRGTYSPGDYGNIENWMTEFLLEKSTSQMKRAWVEDAKLNWTDAMESRAKNDDDRMARVEIRARETTKRQEHAQRLVDAVRQNDTLSQALGGYKLEDVYETGYWKLTKYLVDYAAQKANETDKTLILTGHSQGGTRAQLASMYLHQSTGVEVPTLTFAATGSACVARRLFHKNSNLLEDVDPYVQHSSHLTDIVHPLDPWGNSMLGMDNGQVCHWGTTRTSSDDESIGAKAQEYCARIYGYKGPTLVAAQEGAPFSGAGSAGEELAHDFQRCRYFTHSAEGMLLGLYEEEILDETSNCHEVPAIPENDPEGLCPSGSIPKDEKEAVAAIVVSLMVALGLLCFGLRCIRNRNSIENEEHAHNLLSEMDDSEALAMESEPFQDEPEDVDENGIELL